MNRMFRTTTAIVASLSLLAPGMVGAQDVEADTALPEQALPVDEDQQQPQPDGSQATEGLPDEAATPQGQEEAPEPETSEPAVSAPADDLPELGAGEPGPDASDLVPSSVEEQPQPAEAEIPEPVDPELQDGVSVPAPPNGPETETLQTDDAAAERNTVPEASDRPLNDAETGDEAGDETNSDAGLPLSSEGEGTDRAASPDRAGDTPTAQESVTDDVDTETLRQALEEAAPTEADELHPADNEMAEGTDTEETSTDAQDPATTDAPQPQDADGTTAGEETTVSDQPDHAATDSAPEAAAPETDLAREAAEAVPAAESDALQALLEADTNGEEPVSGEVSEMQITEEDRRSSDEDFLTSITESLTTTQQARDDDDDRDLARMALAGLAGFAVGNMLSNNREVALNTGDRVVVTLPDGSQQLIKDDNALLFQPGSNVQTERYADGSTITTVLREDGSRVVTIRDAEMNVLRRSVQWPDGRSTMLIDETVKVEPVRISELPPPARPVDYTDRMDEDALRQALMRQSDIDRRFTLSQIRNIAQVRALVAPLDIQSITFDTGSAAIRPDQAEQLGLLGRVIADSIADNPGEIFLIEGHTDAIGAEITNLALSDRRAESVALALTEYFSVPPENLVVQGYGEQFLRIATQEAERANRRVAIRRITELIAQ